MKCEAIVSFYFEARFSFCWNQPIVVVANTSTSDIFLYVVDNLYLYCLSD